MDNGRAQRESILRAAKAAREYEHVIEGRTFKMLMPTRHEARLAHQRNSGGVEGDGTVWIKTQRDLVSGAITGWSGVLEKDLIEGGNENIVEFHADLVPILLDARDIWFHELWTDLKGRYDKRDDDIEEQKKKLIDIVDRTAWQDKAQSLNRMGFGAAVNRQPVEITPDVQSAFNCWRFMGGYKPELLPMYAELYGLDDVEKMIELLITIRDGHGN